MIASSPHYSYSPPQPSGAIDRAKLRDLVFRDKAMRMKLTAIVHPFVIMELIRQLLVHCVVRREPFAVVGQILQHTSYAHVDVIAD